MWHEALWGNTTSVPTSYRSLKICPVLLNCNTGDWFRTSVAIRQGCLLSPTLFDIFLERIWCKALDDHEGGMLSCCYSFWGMLPVPGIIDPLSRSLFCHLYLCPDISFDLRLSPSSSPLFVFRSRLWSQRSRISGVTQGLLFRHCLPRIAVTVSVTALMKWVNMKRVLWRENLSSGFATRVDSNRPAQLQKLGRGLIIGTRDIILSRQWTIKMLIRLRGCAGWSAPSLFAYGKNRFSHDVVQVQISCSFHLRGKRCKSITYSCRESTHHCEMSCDMTKPTKWQCAQRRLRSVWSVFDVRLMGS